MSFLYLTTEKNHPVYCADPFSDPGPYHWLRASLLGLWKSFSCFSRSCVKMTPRIPKKTPLLALQEDCMAVIWLLLIILFLKRTPLLALHEDCVAWIWLILIILILKRIYMLPVPKWKVKHVLQEDSMALIWMVRIFKRTVREDPRSKRNTSIWPWQRIKERSQIL